MADGFGVHVSGGDAYKRKLAQFELHLSDLRNFWGLLVPVVHGWMADVFSSQGAWGGAAWAPLSPAYATEKSRTHPGKSILIRDGTLRRAASQMRREVTPRTLTMWIDDDVASLHQTGTDRMPARPLIPSPLPATALRDLDVAATEYLNVLVRQLRL